MKKLSFIFFLLTFFVLVTTRANASTVFYNSLQGQNNTQWLPEEWTVITAGKYGNDGLMGPLQYYKDFSLKNAIIKFDFNIHNALANLVFACRATPDFSYVEQPQFTGNGLINTLHTSNMTECINNNCYGTGDINPYTYLQSMGTHHIEFDCLDNTATLKYDGKIITTANISNDTLGTGVRIYSSGGTDTISNLTVCDSGGCTPTTPTPTPTPTPADIQLTVPEIKQYDLPSGAQIYDSANIWAHNDPYIGSWGCALTSATMVLEHFGISKLPNGTTLNPGSLNDWLKSQPDGYIGNGLLNWLAIPRLTKLIHVAGNNPNFAYDALQYNRVTGANKAMLLADLKSNQPDIVEEPHHFVVATGTKGTTFTINDPYFDYHTIAEGYSDNFLSLGRYVGSHTDLSYLMITGDPSLTFTLTTSTGSTIGDTYVQNPLQDDKNPSQESGSPLKILSVNQASSGEYTLEVTSNTAQLYSLTAYLYDTNGNVDKQIVEGEIDTNHPNTVTFNFNKNNTNGDSVERDVDFPTLLFDLNSLYTTHQIEEGLYTALDHIAINAQRNYEKGGNHRLVAKFELQLFASFLKEPHTKQMTTESLQLLKEDINYLLLHL